MIFSTQEFSAVINLSKAMISADGKVEQIEVAVIFNELKRFNIGTMTDAILQKADKLEFSETIAIVSRMNQENKRYVAALLGTIMAVDMNISDSEMALWRLISTLCALPTMTVKDAVSIMASL
ncbi:MAG: tellurite resistance protein TerB [Bacteroidales bacterium]|nr:tellurite resistance protein TerB [Bacteroidales bacterium]